MDILDSDCLHFLFVFNRILAFSEAPITAVHVTVDGEPLGKARSSGGPLYVLPWDPSLYLNGLHTIRVKVEVSAAFIYLPLKSVWRLLLDKQDVIKFSFFACQDSAGRSSVREQHFTLESDLTPSFGFMQSFLLLSDHYILGRAAFIFMILINVGVLLAFRFLQVPTGRGELSLAAPQTITSLFSHSVLHASLSR